jgi:Protein of unknown function (DUF3631)
MDRAVIIRMRRRAAGEQVDPYRTRRDAPPLNQLRDQLTGWARQQLRELQHATPQMPLEDRAADTWEPLIAIADLAGGDWPTRARTAAVTMTGAEVQQEEDTSAGVRLLADLREVFGAAEALYTTSILEALHKLEDAPWPDWYGHPLSTRDLAKLLRPYDVRSKSVREHGTGPSLKGYARADLHDAWQRYAPPTPQATHPPQASEPPAQAAFAHVAGEGPPSDTFDTDHRDVADVSEEPGASATGLSWDVSHVADVADTSTPNGNGWRYDQPLVPCVACGVGTSNRDPSGRPLHLPCPDPDPSPAYHDHPGPPDDPGR